jgi:hypothetical protein
MDWILWIFWIIFQWVLLLAPAVVLRKYRRRPMNKGQAIGYSAAICLITYILWFLSAYVLGGFDPAMNPGPFALSSLFSFWILRKATVLDGDTSLKMLDRVFKKIFPETNTPRPPQAQRGQNSQAAKSKHEISDEKLPDQFHAPLKNKSKAEKAGNYIRDYVVSPPRPHDMQLQKVSPTDESNMTTTPEIDEDALYEQAFNELQGEERVVSTWSRAFAEAAGDEQKAKALYISARVSSLKQELSAKFEAGRLEAERREADRLSKAEAERKAEEEAERREVAERREEAEQRAEAEADWIPEKEWGVDRFAAVVLLAVVIAGLVLFAFSR